MSISSLPRALRRHWFAAVGALAAVAGVAAGSFLTHVPVATACARVVARQQRVEGTLGPGSIILPVEGPTPDALEALARSDRVLAAALRDLGGRPAVAPTASEIAALRAAVSAARPEGQGPVVEIRVCAPDPVEACRRANAVARAVAAIADADAWRGVETVVAQAHVRAEAAAKRAGELRAEVFSLAVSGGDPDADRKVLLDGLRELDGRVDALRSAIGQREEEIRALLVRAHVERANGSARVVPEAVAIPQLEELAVALSRAQSELANLLLTRFPDEPEVQTKRAEVDGLEARLAHAREHWRMTRMAALTTEVNQAKRELEVYERRCVEKRRDVAAVEARLARYRPACREQEAAERELESCRESERRLESLGSLLPRFVEVADGAERTEMPPRLPVGLLGLWTLAALAAAAAAAGVREACDPRPAGSDEVARLLDAPVLAHVPRGSELDVAGALGGAADSPLTEVFGSLATIVRAALAEGGLKTVGVLSAVPGEGKTLLAAGLAAALARKGLRTVLIDADLRCPRLHEVVGLPNATGLSVLLEGRWPAPVSGRFHGPADPHEPSDLDQAMQEHLYPGLQIITGGAVPENPQLLLESASMKGVLEELKEITDVVVVDTPALGAVGEGLSIATMTDANLLVVRSGAATRGELSWARGLLASVSVNLLGCLFNGSTQRPLARVRPRATGRGRIARLVPGRKAVARAAAL